MRVHPVVGEHDIGSLHPGHAHETFRTVPRLVHRLPFHSVQQWSQLIY